MRVAHCLETVDVGTCAGVAHLGQHDEAGRAFDQSTDLRTVAFTLDQVHSPVAKYGAILDLRRSNVGALNVLDLVTAVDTAAARLAHLIMVARTGDQFSLEFATRMQVDCVVDGLPRDGFIRFVAPDDLEHVRNLLRRS